MKYYSYWWSHSVPAFDLTSQLPHSIDIVIIGAGFAGISTAYWLSKLSKSKKQLRILILEEAPMPGYKASGRSLGHVYHGSNMLPSQVISLIGKDNTKKLYEYSAVNNSMLKQYAQSLITDAEFNGGFKLAITEEDGELLTNSIKDYNDLGIYPILIDKDRIQHIAVAPTANKMLYLANEGMINPFELINQMVRVVRQKYTWVSYGTRVKSTDFVENSPVVILENGHVISAKAIIHTTSNTIRSKAIQQSLIKERDTYVATEQMNSSIEEFQLPFMPIDIGKNSSLRIHNECILMTGGKEKLRGTEVGITNDSSHNLRIFDNINNFMIEHFPFTNMLQLQYVWSAIRSYTKDHLPIIDKISDGEYANIAYDKNEFGLAFLGSKNIAEMVLGLKIKDKINIFSAGRFENV